MKGQHFIHKKKNQKSPQKPELAKLEIFNSIDSEPTGPQTPYFKAR